MLQQARTDALEKDGIETRFTECADATATRSSQEGEDCGVGVADGGQLHVVRVDIRRRPRAG